MDSLRESLFQVHLVWMAVIFFIIIVLLNWLGYNVKKRTVEHHPGKDFSLGTTEGSLMGLMAFLLAFTFGTAFSKFDARRQTVVDEANLVNATYLRCTMYPDSIKELLLGDFRNYLDSRIDYFNAGDNTVKINAALGKANYQFNSLWKKNIRLINDLNYRSRSEQFAMVLINLKNMMISREAGRVAAIPTLIIGSLLVLVFIASFLTGFGLKPGNRNLLFTLAFAIMVAVVLYLIMELGRPQQGYINFEKAEKEIVNLRNNLLL